VTTTCLELKLPAVPASVRKARNAVGDTVSKLSASERVADDIRLCVSEAVSNVVRHAYGTKRGDVEVVVAQAPREVVVVVRDEGKGLTKAHREGRLGGFGLRIIARLTRRCRITSSPNAGVEMEMVFPAEEPVRSRSRRSPTRRSTARTSTA
jgi:anti-sigma regulatory factor (Ser/Thr protein kinase)